MLICSGAINGAGAVFVEILMKPNEEEDGGAEGRVTELGGLLSLLFCILHQNLEQFSSPHERWQIISNAHEPSLSCRGIFLFLLVFVIYFPIFYLNILQHTLKTYLACL